MTWETQFPNKEDIERCVEGSSDFVRDGDTPARQGEHDHVRSAFQMAKSSGQLNACVATVFIGSLMGRPGHVESSCCAHGMMVQARCLAWHIGCAFDVRCLAQKRQV
jgi:hypothetical protein